MINSAEKYLYFAEIYIQFKILYDIVKTKSRDEKSNLWLYP